MTESAVDLLMQCAPWQRAFTVQRETVRRFYQECTAVLWENCPVITSYSIHYTKLYEGQVVGGDVLDFYCFHRCTSRFLSITTVSRSWG